MTTSSASSSFEIRLAWPAPGNSRNSVLSAGDKPTVPASSPAEYGGDATRYNPEELMLMSLSQCHMLTYLAIADKRKLTVLAYEDRASGWIGTGTAGTAGKISFQEVVLRPRVTVARGNAADALAMHDKARANCFMANSVNFPVRHEPEIVEA